MSSLLPTRSTLVDCVTTPGLTYALSEGVNFLTKCAVSIIKKQDYTQVPSPVNPIHATVFSLIAMTSLRVSYYIINYIDEKASKPAVNAKSDNRIRHLFTYVIPTAISFSVLTFAFKEKPLIALAQSVGHLALYYISQLGSIWILTQLPFPVSGMDFYRKLMVLDLPILLVNPSALFQ